MKIMMLSNQSRSMATFWAVLMRTMTGQGMEVTCCTPDQGDEVANLGYPAVRYSLDRKGMNPLKDLGTAYELYKIFQQHKPDIVFATTIKPVIYGSLAARFAKIPHIFATITGLGYAFEVDSLPKKALNLLTCQLYRKSLAHARGIFFQNHDDAKLFRQKKILAPSAKVLFARGTGVDIDHFAQAPFPDLAPFTFLLIGRLLEAKGIREYVKAALAFKQKFPAVKFQLLGVPETGPGSISLAEIESYGSTVEYLGQTRDVRPYIANSHVVVLPSWREGLPTALMEAMSMGRPIVATNVPGCREVLKPGHNGFFSEPGNVPSLTQAMQNFLEHPELIYTMGQAGRHRAEQEFDARIVAKTILNDMARSMQ